AHRRPGTDPLRLPARPRPEPHRTLELPGDGRMSQHTQALAAFLADLRYEQVPAAVLDRTEDLFLDWLGSALASQGAHPIPLFERYRSEERRVGKECRPRAASGQLRDRHA